MALYRSPEYQTSFGSIGLSVQEKVQNKFSIWWPWWDSWISNQNVYLLLIYKSPRQCQWTFVNLPFGLGEKSSNTLSTYLLGRLSWISIKTTAVILSYKSSQYFLSSFESAGISVQETKLEIDFQDGDCGSHIGFFDQNNLLFLIYMSPRYYQVSSQSAFWFRRKVQNRLSRRPWWSSWISDRSKFSYFVSESHP